MMELHYEKDPRTVGAVQRAERKFTMKHYNIKTRTLTIIAVISVVIMLAMIGLNIWQEIERRAVWIGSYPMANQHIEWTGAGYSFPFGEED